MAKDIEENQCCENALKMKKMNAKMIYFCKWLIKIIKMFILNVPLYLLLFKAHLHKQVDFNKEKNNDK